MRNTNGSNEYENFGIGSESDPLLAERARSADQLALVWNTVGEMVAAYPLPETDGASRIRVLRFPSDVDLAAALSTRRAKETGLPALSADTHFLTSVADYSELTRILALDGERLAYSDQALLDWLISAEKEMVPGTDNHPVFDTSLEDTACTVSRLPNGQVSITEASRQHIQALGAKVRAAVGEQPLARIDLCVETPLRSAARYFLCETNEGAEILRPGNESEVSAFLVVNKDGYSLGLWSPAYGLFSEYAFLAPDEITRAERGTDEIIPTPKIAGRTAAATPTEDYVRHAFEQVLVQAPPAMLAGAPIKEFSKVIWVVEHGLDEIAELIAAECAVRSGVEFIGMSVPAEDAVASGLLLGSYSFGRLPVAGNEIMATVDMVRDIMFISDAERTERQLEVEARLQNRRSRAATLMFAVPVIVAALLSAFAIELFISNLMTARRESIADARTQELKPAVDRRNSYEANLKWYREFVTEVTGLRRQQPVGIGMLFQLNSNYPFSIDPAFYISEMKLSNTGDVEIKGLAKSKDGVAAFLKSLEYAGGAESGSRLFSGLAYEVQETTPAVTTGQPAQATPTGSTLSTAAVAPGVVVWSIKGNYLPMAEFAPKKAKSTGPANPGQEPPNGQPSEPQPTGLQKSAM